MFATARGAQFAPVERVFRKDYGRKAKTDDISTRFVEAAAIVACSDSPLSQLNRVHTHRIERCVWIGSFDSIRYAIAASLRYRDRPMNTLSRIVLTSA